MTQLLLYTYVFFYPGTKAGTAELGKVDVASGTSHRSSKLTFESSCSLGTSNIIVFFCLGWIGITIVVVYQN